MLASLLWNGFFQLYFGRWLLCCRFLAFRNGWIAISIPRESNRWDTSRNRMQKIVSVASCGPKNNHYCWLLHHLLYILFIIFHDLSQHQAPLHNYSLIRHDICINDILNEDKSTPSPFIISRHLSFQLNEKNMSICDISLVLNQKRKRWWYCPCWRRFLVFVVVQRSHD